MNGFFSLSALSMKSNRRCRHFLIHRLHTLLRERAGVFDLAARETVDHPARAEFLLEVGVLRIIEVLWFFLGVQVIEIAEELIEAMIGRQGVVPVAQVVLAELAGRVT